MIQTGQFKRFFYIPYKNKFTYVRDAIDEIVKPFTNDLMASVSYWENAQQHADLDVYLMLPKVMSGITAIRMRSADAQVASSFALGLAGFARLYTLYDPGSAKTIRSADQKNNHTPQSDWEESIKDPRFGLLTDKEFYASIKDRYLKFAQGVDLAYAALLDREQKNQNDHRDLSQIGRTTIKACTSSIQNTHISYENYSCATPTDMTVPYILTTAGSDQRDRLATKGGQYQWEISFEPSVDKLREGIDFYKRALSGPVKMKKMCDTNNGFYNNEYEVTFWIDVPTYLQNPVKNLTEAGPKFDDHGEIRDLRDHTLHGLFPQGIPCAH